MSYFTDSAPKQPNRDELQPGIYEATLLEVKAEESRAGDPVVVLKWSVGPTKRYAWLRLRMNNTGMKFARWQLDVMGLMDMVSAARDGFEAQSLALTACQREVGARYQVEIKHREWNGKVYPDITLKQRLGDQDAGGGAFADTPEFTDSDILF